MWTLWGLRWTRRFDQHAGKADPRRLSLNATTKAFEDNQKVIDSIMEQWCNVSNMESSKQQGEAMKEYTEDMGKIMMVFRRLANGDIVPRTDEKKLMEYDDKMYQMAKNMQLQAMQMDKKHNLHKYTKHMVDFCRRELNLKDNVNAYNYQSMSVCIIDCVFSLRARYKSTTKEVVNRYAIKYMLLCCLKLQMNIG